MKRATTVPGRPRSQPAVPGALTRWGELDTDWLFPVALFLFGVFVSCMMPGIGGLYLLAYFPILAIRKLAVVLRVGLLEWLLFVAVAGNLTGLMARETDWSLAGGVTAFCLWEAQLISVLILGLAWSQDDGSCLETSTWRRLLITLTGTVPGGLLVVLAHQAAQRRQVVEEGALMLFAALIFYLVLLGLRSVVRDLELMDLRRVAGISLPVLTIFLPGQLVLAAVVFLWNPDWVLTGSLLVIAVAAIMIPAC